MNFIHFRLTYAQVYNTLVANDNKKMEFNKTLFRLIGDRSNSIEKYKVMPLKLMKLMYIITM